MRIHISCAGSCDRGEGRKKKKKKRPRTLSKVVRELSQFFVHIFFKAPMKADASPNIVTVRS